MWLTAGKNPNDVWGLYALLTDPAPLGHVAPILDVDVHLTMLDAFHAVSIVATNSKRGRWRKEGKMVRLYRALARVEVVIVFFLLILLFSLYLFPTDADTFRDRGGPAHAEIQREYRKDRFILVVEQWGEHTGSIESAVQRYQAHLLKLDFVFPLVYVVFLLSAIAWLTNDPDKDPARWILALFLLPVAAGIFDLAENCMHIGMLQGIKSLEGLNNISADLIFISFVFTVLKYVSLLGSLMILAVAGFVSLYRRFYRMDRQTRPPEELKNVYTRDLGVVREREIEKIAERRKQAAKEFGAALAEDALVGSVAEYKKQLGKDPGERGGVGLAFSGGGIRSASFNLGLVQGLTKYGVLPWIDYLTSVSGGGLTAACMTTLLSLDKKEKGKREYYHFNTQWDRFPLNPDVKAFDGQGVAHEHEGEPVDGVGPPLERGLNEQLAYLRDKGYYLIPRRGWFTLDLLRGVGAILMRASYTVFVFLLVLLAFSAFHYGITAVFTPGIGEDIDLTKVDDPIHLIVGSQGTAPGTVLLEEIRPTPESIYLGTLAAGFGFSILIGLTLVIFYKKDPTWKYKLRPWRSPVQDITFETYLVMHRLRLFALGASLVLLILGLSLWIGKFQDLLQSVTRLPNSSHLDWVWALPVMLAAFVLAAGWLVFKYSPDYRWAKQGLSEQVRIDEVMIRVVALLFAWAMTLWIAWLRFPLSSSTDSQIFWIWLPAVFTLGSLIGLIAFYNIPLWQRVHARSEVYDLNSIGRLGRLYFERVLGIEPDPEYEPVSSAIAPDYQQSRWGDPELRSIFWTLQGLALYGLLAFLLLALLVLPQYFLVGVGADSNVMVQLATAVMALSAGWAAVLSYVNRAVGFKPENLAAKIITLPGELRNYVLGLLVVVLNLSILFVLESTIDDMSALQACLVGLIAVGVLYCFGKFADFNYLAQHYFARDRIADVFMRTEVATGPGQIEAVRDDRGERLLWMTPAGCSAPYHIVITSLSLPGSWRLQVKDRKSQPFIFSKYYCGSDITGYVRTQYYRGGATKYARAIALSGACISSSLGYHTFFAQAFMTTLFNARLGLWMTNPAQYDLDVLRRYARPHQRETRAFWPGYLWDEATAAISERRPLINLTDGEHTGDNIGLYPLFQRRCKVIIAGDAGDDPEGLCGALFRVLYQVKADLNIDVDINVDGLEPAKYDKEKKEAEPSQRHFAIGRIHYPETRDALGHVDEAAEDGWLVYFKPTVVSSDPSKIRKYWEACPMEFPHQSTLDQFFDEEQFEIQRYLGEWTVEHILVELGKFCERRIKQEEDQALIDKYTARQALLDRLLDGRIGFNAFLVELLKDKDIDLSDYQETIDEFMGVLQAITSPPKDQKEA